LLQAYWEKIKRNYSMLRKPALQTIFTLGLLLILTLASAGQFTSIASQNEVGELAQAKISPNLAEAIQKNPAGVLIPVIITMKDQADLSSISVNDRDERLQAVIEALQSKAAGTQPPILKFLATKRATGEADLPTSLWIFNGLIVSVSPIAAQQLAARPDVLRIAAVETIPAPEAETHTQPVEPNVDLINAPDVWAMGYRGEGMVIASMDTGVSVNHPDLSGQWRGGSNSWYDPYGENQGPVDLNGHGTRTMGVMVGRDAGGSSIGAAPQAQWIAVKIFNNSGSATTSAIHLGFQWLLDPDGNPSTPDAPHVVNNSWNYASPGCNLEFQLDLRALRAAGILPVFAAGNAGPNSATSVSPANNPEAFAVGAIDNLSQIYPASSRGPSACGEPQTIFPELVAPGVNILSSDRYGTYSYSTGTSLAAPHISAGLALLLSAYPNLTANQQELALLNGVVDLGEPGADNDFGMGRIDLLAAYQYILNTEGQPTPAPHTPTPTPLPTNTASPTSEPAPTSTATPTSAPPTATPPPAVNLALGKPVSVSSSQDSGHTGSQAVDGNLDTTWQTKRLNKNKSTSEWIKVDLGSAYDLAQVTLKWDAYYASSYAIRVSTDNSAWTTVYSTTAGNGAVEEIGFTLTTARYVMMVSTAWSDSYQRIWLKEFEIFGGEASSPATPTAAPTSTPTATPTQVQASPTPGAGAGIHSGDLDGSSSPGIPNRWNAVVTITVHMSDEAPAGGVTVSGVWSGGVSRSGSCLTGSSGQCTLTLTNIKNTVSSATFSIIGMTHSEWVYQESANHDPDGDSNGTTIVILIP
jgi:subtilisin family serine protease